MLRVVLLGIALSACATASSVRTPSTIRTVVVASLTVPTFIEVNGVPTRVEGPGVEATFEKLNHEFPADVGRSARRWAVSALVDREATSELEIMLARGAEASPSRALGGLPVLPIARLQPTHPLREATVAALSRLSQRVGVDAALVTEARCRALTDVPVPFTEKGGVSVSCELDAALVTAWGEVIDVSPLHRTGESVSVSLIADRTEFNALSVAEVISRLASRFASELGVVSGSRRESR